MKIDPNALCYPVAFDMPEFDQGYPTGRKTNVFHSGLTKREYFIAAALQGLCANPESGNMSSATVAYEAIKYADAVIKQLNEEK